MGLDFQQFTQGLSFSYWECLDGANRTVIADSAIPGRYYVMTTFGKETVQKSYIVLDGGRITSEYSTGYDHQTESDLRKGLPGLINLYERIRKLRHFDPNHCPIMEFQTVMRDGKPVDYFLQYHKVRDFEPCTFRLDRPPRKGEIEAFFVRGATPSYGMIYKTTIITHLDLVPPDWIEGCVVPRFESVYFEIIPRRTDLLVKQIKSTSADRSREEILRSVGLDIADGHLNRSQMFKPRVSLVIPRLFDGYEVSIRSRSEEPYPTVDIELISDGRRAYFRVCE